MAVYTNLNRARVVKNDEFYTQLKDIEKELSYYTEHFKNKVVYCNCDDPETSSFYAYFKNNFIPLQLRSVLATSYVAEGHGKFSIFDNSGIRFGLLDGDGSYDSAECIAILQRSDIVCTNPPFSLFIPFFKLLTSEQISFLVIGNLNAVTYTDIFPKIKNREVWTGVVTGSMKFSTPCGHLQHFGNLVWYTNLAPSFSRPPIDLDQGYSPIAYPVYDNYSAINVDRIKDIPKDYYGVMGVPFTFACKDDGQQFTIVSVVSTSRTNWVYVNNVKKYKRILIIRNKE